MACPNIIFYIKSSSYSIESTFTDLWMRHSNPFQSTARVSYLDDWLICAPSGQWTRGNAVCAGPFQQAGLDLVQGGKLSYSKVTSLLELDSTIMGTSVTPMRLSVFREHCPALWPIGTDLEWRPFPRQGEGDGHSYSHQTTYLSEALVDPRGMLWVYTLAYEWPQTLLYNFSPFSFELMVLAKVKMLWARVLTYLFPK